MKVCVHGLYAFGVNWAEVGVLDFSRTQTTTRETPWK